jgi:hypothetical protein
MGPGLWWHYIVLHGSGPETIHEMVANPVHNSNPLPSNAFYDSAVATTVGSIKASVVSSFPSLLKPT